MFVAIFFTLAAATLEDATTFMDEVYVSSFLSPEDITRSLDVKEVLQKSAISNQGVDLISQLSELLNLPREDAIDHFIDHNRPELKIAMVEVGKLMKAPNDVVLAGMLSSGVLPSPWLIPLVSLVAAYITGKRTMCLYDHLPMGLRNPSEYARLFTTVEDLPVIPQPSEAVDVTLPDDHSPDHAYPISAGNGILLFRSFGGIPQDQSWLFRKKIDHFLRILDIPGKCAVALAAPYRDIVFIPRHRAVFTFGTDIDATLLDMWRADSVKSVRLHYSDSQRDLVSQTADGSFFLVHTRTRSYDAPPFSKRSYILPTDLSLAFQTVPISSVNPPALLESSEVKKYTLRHSDGSLSVLSEEGFRRIFSLVRAEDMAVKEKLAAIKKLASRRHYQISSRQTAVMLLVSRDLTYSDCFKDLRGLSDILNFPINEWHAWYLDFLDRVTAE